MSIDNAAGFVLAGGQSRRMGRDKALLSFAGKPLIARAVELLRQAGLTTAIAGDRADLSEFAPVIQDKVSAQGPLGGICAALESTDARWSVFLPVDVPLVPSELIAYLLRQGEASGAAVTLASCAGTVQTFPVALDRAVLPRLRADLDAGLRKCSSALETAAAASPGKMKVIPVEPLAESREVMHPAGLATTDWFLNVNTLDDLNLAESLLRHPIS